MTFQAGGSGLRLSPSETLAVSTHSVKPNLLPGTRPVSDKDKTGFGAWKRFVPRLCSLFQTERRYRSWQVAIRFQNDRLFFQSSVCIPVSPRRATSQALPSLTLTLFEGKAL
ncbi:hypothetical protein MPNT_550007 [Candidatus Methylacidithermus pantelleriae]|uniref:Uncharacterized protein n=1 Tax=Candidatus Methylacidithermus pantelleriae TaxID=2744239 RepID=A0A8J2BP25_9BACT|nr:hypothetical protein MPNT_550007 [Candidatus Methylacidithermus pantelleriae]